MTMTETEPMPRLAKASYLAGGLEAQRGREWLIVDGRGGYASGTVAGLPTRRYHGLLVAAARPPLERWLMLSAVLERVGVGGRHHEMANFQFDRIVHPEGYRHLKDFAVSNRAGSPWVRFDYDYDGLRLTKHVSLVPGRDEVSVAYKLEGPDDDYLSFGLCPFLAMRDFHSLTRAFAGSYATAEIREFVTVDAFSKGPRLWLSAQRADGGEAVVFDRQPDWWRGFVYDEETARGQDDHEDLFVPGWFRATGRGVIELEFRAAADFTQDLSRMPETREARRVEAVALSEPAGVEDRLREAAAAFVVTRCRAEGDDLATILAGYHWFGDWGRDTFIALPGLLLETGRLREARQVLEVFASSQRDGLIPNRFSDYGDGRDYNSVDASLWFVQAADAYMAAGGEESAWRQTLGPACQRMVEAFEAGTRFKIGVDPEDGLLACGDESTQLTWMDAKCGDVAFTPRHGKPVEVNALWYHALCVLAERMATSDGRVAERCGQMATRVAETFERVFWNERSQCLYDVVRGEWKDPAVRPNQVFAVSLPNSPLERSRQRAVVEVVEKQLLTPVGLRSLCRKHPSYAGRYEGNPFERDRVYHQGTVWAWLIGPFVEAYLRVNGFSADARLTARGWLGPLIDHLDEACIGSVNEIFDGDSPHRPRGCVAQAWSVAELLRAWRMTEPVAS